MVLSSIHEECIFYFSLNMVRTLQTIVIFYSMVYIIAYIYSNVMEFTWNPPGIHLESSGMVVESTSSFHVESRWNDGIQMEFGHSM